MTGEPTFEQLLAEGGSVPLEGWDFSPWTATPISWHACTGASARVGHSFRMPSDS
jgi:hypothetical protein